MLSASRGDLDRGDLILLMSDVALALADLQRRGLAHGRLSPSHLIVDAGGTIHIVVDAEQFTGGSQASDTEAAGIEARRYIAPESLTPAGDWRADVFAFGAVLHDVLTAEAACRGGTGAEAIERIRRGPLDLHSTSAALGSEITSIVARCLQPDPDRRYQTWDELASDLEHARTSPLIGRAPAAPAAPIQPLHQNVQFTVYRRSIVAPDRWYPMLAFAHLASRPLDAAPDEPDPVAEVQRQAKQVLGDTAAEFQPLIQDSSQPIPERGHLRFVPSVEHVEFNPRAELSVDRVGASRGVPSRQAGPRGGFARGVVAAYLGHLLVAEISIAIEVDDRVGTPRPIADAARPYRRIFASYSHSDTAIVEELEEHLQSLGDEYLRDVTQLRSGERWSSRLAEMIASADVFQLFWSWNALQSPFVRAEWECALSLGRGHFIRPVYWEEPLPRTPDLPPPALLALHFKRIRSRPAVTRDDAGSTADPFALPSLSHDVPRPDLVPDRRRIWGARRARSSRIVRPA